MRNPKFACLIFAVLGSLEAWAFAGPIPSAPVPASGASAPASANPYDAAANAVNPKAAPDTLDQKRVHAEYGDGNFETVVQLLEGYRARHEHYRLADSLIIAKYLGVVYTSNPDTREKGKYWLYRMLQMDPSADLVDLYVGEEVDKTFEKVRQEFIVRRNYRGINDTRLNKAIREGEPPKVDTVVRKDTVVVQNDNYLAPITEGIKGGYNEVKGDIKAGIEAGYVPIQDTVKPTDSHWTWNINVGGGLKFLDKSEWDPVGFSDETEFRLATDIRQRTWPISIALDFGYAYSPKVFWDLTAKSATDTDLGIPEISLMTEEINFGVRKIFDFKLYTVRPFFGGGFSYIHSDWSLIGDKINTTYSDGKLGVWVSGGAYWELDRHFNIGGEWLYSWARIDMLGSRNHGGTHADMIVGYHY